MFGSIDLLGPKEMILSFAQSLLKSPVDPYERFFEFCHNRFYKKYYA